MRDAQTAMARGSVADSRRAVATAPAAVRRKAGVPAVERRKSATRRRFQNDMPTQTATRRLASSIRRHSASRASVSSNEAGRLPNGSR